MNLQTPELTKRQRTHHDGCLPHVGRSQLSGMNASVVVRRLAALSGASAVGAGAYGAHGTDSHIHTFTLLRLHSTDAAYNIGAISTSDSFA